METAKITIRGGNLFPFQFQYFAILLLIFSLLLLISYPFFSPFPLILALIIFTGSYGLEIMPVEKQYRTFNSILFIKKGQWKTYTSIEKIYITTSSRSQKVYTRVTEGPTIRKQYYNAYLKFADGKKEFLQSKKTKRSLIKNLQKLNDHFGLEITDHAE
jgi:hypothetical protein